jgi:hypothetical protein
MVVYKPAHKHFQTGPQHINTTTQYTKNHVLSVYIHLYLGVFYVHNKNTYLRLSAAAVTHQKRASNSGRSFRITMRCLAQHTENGRNYASASIAES